MENNVVNSGVASRLVRISELSQLTFGTKVRFLGCVIQYDGEQGLLYLHEAAYSQPESSNDDPRIIAGVDISFVHTKADQLTTGNWINIIGFIEGPRYKPVSMGDDIVQGIKIRAQSLWNAGVINPEEYFKAVTAMKAAFH